MIVRLLLVVLVSLNLSAAAWWLFHREHALPATTTAGAVPALQLVDASGSSAPATATDKPETIPADAVCASFGPFADAAATEQARQKLRPVVIRVDARQVAKGGKTVFWLDVAAFAGFDPAVAGPAIHAPHGERVSCAAASG